MESVGYLDFDDFFRWSGGDKNRFFSKQMEYGMINQSSLTRSFFPTNFHSNLNTI